jgi:uncharacterized LabA/DUF88 family protein
MGENYMLRAMVFIDHMNFYSALRGYYEEKHGTREPDINYRKLPYLLLSRINSKAILLKTFLFVPEPDDFIKQDSFWSGYYNWVTNMGNNKNFDVISGRYVARRTQDHQPMDISDKSTYYKVEKGTDINLAVSVITKAYNNAFDIAVIVSGDADFDMVFSHLKMIGKISALATVKGQNISKIIKCADSNYIMDEDFFEACKITPKK